MKKTIAVLGSAALLSFSGAGIAAAQDDATDQNTDAPATTQQDDATTQQDDGDAGDDVETPEEVSDIAKQLCGTVSAYDFLGSAEGVVPGLTGEECEANADAAVEAATSGDIAGALDILRGIDAETPDEETEGGSVELPGSLGGAADDGQDDGESEAPVDAETLTTADA